MTDASAAGTTHLGDAVVPRLGYGTMRLPGPGIWGPPRDREEALAVLRRAVELGVRLIDTAWYYGADVANELVAEALHPYPEDLVLATKLGGTRGDDGSWGSAVDPGALRAGNERDLRGLRLDTVPLTHLRWPGPDVPGFDEAVATMVALRDAGRIRRIGLSNVTLGQLDAALGAGVEVASVSNHYGLTRRDDDAMVDRCAAEGIAYLPFFPLGGDGGRPPAAVSEIAERRGLAPTQVTVAWLLHRSPTLVPIPGTSRREHLEQNVAAAAVALDAAEMAALDSAGGA